MIHSYNKLPDAVGGHKSNISLKFEPLATLYSLLLGGWIAKWPGISVWLCLWYHFCRDVDKWLSLKRA